MEDINNHPKISVIMSVFNSETFLKSSIESILNQTFKDFEFLIIDDASTDYSYKIVQSYQEKDNRIVLLKNEQNMGLTKSLNMVLNLARGTFIARQDADDLSIETRLEKQYKVLMSNPEIALVSTSASIIDSENNEIFPRHYKLSPEQIPKYLKRHNIIVHGSVMFRKKEIFDLGCYREHFRYAQDYDLWLRLIEKHKIRIIPEYLYKIIISLDNLSMKNCFLQEKFAKIAKKFYFQRRRYGKDNYENFFRNFNFETIKTDNNRAKARYHFLRGIYLLGKGKISLLRKELISSIKYYPFSLEAYFYFLISLFGLKGINILRKIRDLIYKL